MPQYSHSQKQGEEGIIKIRAAIHNMNWIFRELSNDTGVDGIIEIVKEGRPTGQLIGVQSKSGKSYVSEEYGDNILARIDTDHFMYWSSYAIPIIYCAHSPKSDIIYWQVIQPFDAEQTQAAYKILLPKSNKLDSVNASKLVDIATPVAHHIDVSVHSFEDCSTGLAHRCAIKIILSGNVNKSDVKRIIVDQISRYQVFTSKHGEKVNADVIFIFCYTGLNDLYSNALFCRALWVSSSLDPSLSPSFLEGERLGENLIIDFCENIEILRALSKDRMNKYDYIGSINEFILSARDTMQFASSLILENENVRISDQDLDSTLGNFFPSVRKQYLLSGRVGNPPIECSELSIKFRSMMAYLDNFFMMFSESEIESRTRQNRIWLAKRYIADFRQSSDEYDNELGRVGR